MNKATCDCYYLLFLALLLFLDCFELFFFLNRGYIKNNPSTFEVGVESVYTLPSLDPTLWDYTGYVVVVGPQCTQKAIIFVPNTATNGYLHNIY